MLRGHRGIIVALVGWLVLCGANAPAQSQKQGDSAEKDRTPGFAPFKPYPNVNESRCYNAPDHDQADLCAQWRAAFAAEKSASAAVSTYWLSLVAAILTAIGTVALFVTLRLTRQTLNTQMTADRPVFLISNITVVKAAKSTVKHPISLHFLWSIANHGATVGFVDEINLTARAGKQQPKSLSDSGTTRLRIPVKAGGVVKKTDKATHYNFTPGDINIALGTEKISVAGFIRYHNVAQQRWETHFSLVVEIDQEFNSVLWYPVPGLADPIDRMIA